jgi:hypothetical protein
MSTTNEAIAETIATKTSNYVEQKQKVLIGQASPIIQEAPSEEGA